jgi:hypothetical protein
LPWRCLLRGVAKVTSKASAPLGRRQLALASRQRPSHPGRQAFSPCNRAAPARHCALVRRALASLVDPGQGAGAVLKRARSRPLHPSSRRSVRSVRGRAFRQLRFGGSPRAAASIGSDNGCYRKRFLGGLMSATVTKERSLRAPQRSPSRIRGGAFRPLGSGCSPRGGASLVHITAVL